MARARNPGAHTPGSPVGPVAILKSARDGYDSIARRCVRRHSRCRRDLVTAPMRLFLFLSFSLVLAGCAPSAPPAQTARKAPVHGRDASDAFFEQERVVELDIEIAPAELEKLRENNRAYVRCRLREAGGQSWSEVGVKLKGAAGSFREFDDKPALTLSMNRFRKKKDDGKQAFHSLDKFHLNNAVQDDTWLHEALSADLFADGGVPAPRVAHARVRLNDRDVGLYVLKEGFDRYFLSRHFATPDGNLYDGGFCQDIDEDLERDAGEGAKDFADLHALRAACEEPDPDRRWRRIAERLDVDAFLTFAALELMAGHWDGYCLSHNNYRVYFDAPAGKAYFLPHGMDQMFGNADASIFEWPHAIVAAAVMQNSEWRSRYRERVRKLLPLFASEKRLLPRVVALQRRIRPTLEKIDPQLARDHGERIEELKDRLKARYASLTKQIDEPDPGPPGPLEFDADGSAGLPDWHEEAESEDAVHEEIQEPNERNLVSIACGPSGQCIASWRCGVILTKGEYRLRIPVRTEGVAAIVDEKGKGAGIRISGAARSEGLEGTADWQPLEFRFTVEDDQREVVLVAELRATAGRVWFDVTAARLFRE